MCNVNTCYTQTLSLCVSDDVIFDDGTPHSSGKLFFLPGCDFEIIPSIEF